MKWIRGFVVAAISGIVCGWLISIGWTTLAATIALGVGYTLGGLDARRALSEDQP